MTNNVKTDAKVATKPALVLVGLCLIGLVLSTVYYRATHSFLDVREIKSAGDAQQGPMAEVTALMQRVEKDPEDIEALQGLGNAFMHMKSWDRALGFWNKVLAIEPHDAMALNQQGVCLFQKQDYTAAAATFERLLEVQGENVYALFNLGILYRHFLGDPGRGEAYLRKIVELKPDNQDVLKAVMEELASDIDQNGTDAGKTS